MMEYQELITSFISDPYRSTAIIAGASVFALEAYLTADCIRISLRNRAERRTLDQEVESLSETE